EIFETKQRDALAPGDLRSVGEAEVLGLDRLYAEVVEDCCGHDAVDGAGVDEEFDGARVIGTSDVRNFEIQYIDSHETSLPRRWRRGARRTHRTSRRRSTRTRARRRLVGAIATRLRRCR